MLSPYPMMQNTVCTPKEMAFRFKLSSYSPLRLNGKCSTEFSLVGQWFS